MMVNLGAAVNVVQAIRTHTAHTHQPHATTTAWMRADR